ncbi:MAG: 5-dehydro-4-deoxy-D-glucuronate isomerase [Bacteroidota bacterium]|nr:5-dehydro-4-deoxy-D-glucuronate isomerase [Bacteroidota bacterium]MDP4214559.1 5-dehydro-4-deoxy-D-glucuronate isomerase [Bacteroidota bacterium]MDP4254855.1 5-dehydro-4-deoxy-D-glucuronate isomerase [Bacteroidota bacterium]MDP4257862.1 5-dehydro-4-deoxy-D-glucuronate isomerase [Bacteroidota bacterium]
MEIRFEHSPKETAEMNTEALRSSFLAGPLMKDDTVQLMYTHYDRVIIGGAKPVRSGLLLDTHPELKADFFLERREVGIINVGGRGRILADDQPREMDRLDCLYLGKGVKKVIFESIDPKAPALFYLLSAPAHATHPVQFLAKENALPSDMGAPETSNARTIYKYIHAQGIRSCQLVMGLTILKTGSVWNTMPAHTHTRRMEAYFYFDLPEGQRVFHFMGRPDETRHLVVEDHQAIVSPPWSIHSGCGTSNYAFIWGMAGENYTYTDMDPVSIPELR